MCFLLIRENDNSIRGYIMQELGKYTFLFRQANDGTCKLYIPLFTGSELKNCM